MTDWRALTHAYGPADDVPGLLATAAAAGPDDDHAWDDLWSRLCHQSSVYPASYAALPHLAAAAAADTPRRYLQPLQLAAAIIASTDTGGADVHHVKAQHGEAMAQLEQLAIASLARPEVRSDPTAFVHALQAVLAFRGVPAWGNHLDLIADGGFSFPCPSCDTYLTLVLDDTPGIEVAHRIAHLFGHATCPRCTAPLSVTQLVTADAE